MKKLTRKLFISVMTLVLTAMALGTSTFAWFSMNTRATATGMEVTAKSNAVYLLIGNESNVGANDAATATAIQTANLTTIGGSYVTANNENKKVYPAAYYTAAGTLGSTATQANKWYTAGNTDVNDSNTAAKIVNVSEVTEGDGDYMLTYTIYLTISKDSDPLTDRYIKVTPTIADNSNVTVASGKSKITDPVSCLVIFGDDAAASTERLNFASSTTPQYTNGFISLASDDVVKVTVYVYINGNDASVKSQNLIDGNALTGILSLQFDLVKTKNE